MADDGSFVNLAGCDPAAVLERAKALIASSRTPEARKQAKTDCGYYLLRASIEEALQKLKARNESPVGKMAKDEVLAHMPYVREFLRANASDDVQELLDALTDDEISTLYVARLVSIDLILITTPEELREFCERFSDLDARKITAYGTYLVISLWNDKDQVERMTWYVGAAAKQTISQRQKDYLNIFEKLERGEKVSRQRAVFNEKTHDHIHLPFTTTAGPTGVTDWPRILCKAFTGKSLPQFTDDVLNFLFVTLDETIGAAILNTVFGGYPGLTKLYGMRFEERQLEPGNTQVPLLSHRHKPGVQTSRPAKRVALASSSEANRPVATGPAPAPAPAPAVASAAKPATATTAPASLVRASTAGAPSTSVPRWVRIVAPLEPTSQDDLSEDEGFSVVSVSRADADKDAETVEIKAVLSAPDRAEAAQHLLGPNGWPAVVVDGRIMVAIGDYRFALSQQSLRSLDAQHGQQHGSFPPGKVSIKVRGVSGAAPLAATSTASWMLTKYSIVIQGETLHRSRFEPLGGVVDDEWARFLHLAAEIMSLRHGRLQSERMEMTTGGIGGV